MDSKKLIPTPWAWHKRPWMEGIMELTKNDVFEIGVENAEAAVTHAAIAHRRYLRSRGAERCEKCGQVTCTPVWVTRRYLCRDCAKEYSLAD
jgi:hypothetical protein